MFIDPVKPSSNPSSAKSDSFFGMALAQAFTGFALGPVAEMIWDAGETLSAVYEDRFEQKRTNGRGVYVLGERNSLGGAFACFTEKTLSEQDRATFTPSMRPSYGFSSPSIAF
jgi:hypothetical protein